MKKVFLEILQNSKENNCARNSFFNKVAGLRRATLLKKSLWHWCFPVNFAKFLRTSFFKEHLRWLLLGAVSKATKPCHQKLLLKAVVEVAKRQRV